jgi:hypothetical protein
MSEPAVVMVVNNWKEYVLFFKNVEVSLLVLVE